MKRMNDKCFVDTNVLLYLLSDDVRKKSISKELLLQYPVISLQVINELSNVCLRKFKLSSEQLLLALNGIERFTKISQSSISTTRKAIQLQSRYRLQYYDSLIVAAALESDCNVLYSEDMQHGLVIDQRLSIVNPFVSD